MGKHAVLLMCTALCFLQPLAAEKEDSLRTQNLQEVVIEGKTAWADGNKLMFIPSKPDKRLSNSIESLLQRMSMPVIRIIDGQIQNTKGRSVTVYVNGVKADNMDYATFWPKQTVRVEYVEYPSDPRFNGEACVVNIVTKASQYGGVAKLNARQEIKNTGKYEGATKLEHRTPSARRRAFGQMGELSRRVLLSMEYEFRCQKHIQYSLLWNNPYICAHKTRLQIGWKPGHFPAPGFRKHGRWARRPDPCIFGLGGMADERRHLAGQIERQLKSQRRLRNGRLLFLRDPRQYIAPAQPHRHRDRKRRPDDIHRAVQPGPLT